MNRLNRRLDLESPAEVRQSAGAVSGREPLQLGLPDVVLALADAVTPQITVDQFGWLPRSRKVAVFAEPVRGQNAGVAYHPGPGFEVRRQADGAVVFRGNVEALERGQGQRAGRRSGLACGLQRFAGTRHLLPLRSRQPSPLVSPFGSATTSTGRCCATRCGPSTTSAAARRSPRSTAATGITAAGTSDPTRIARPGTPRAARRRAGPATCSAAGSTRGTSTSTCPTSSPPSSTCSGPTSSTRASSATIPASPRAATAFPTCSTR